MKRDNGAVLYWCDPEKNTECRKMSCCYLLTLTEGGVCCATFRKEFARTDSQGKPMVYKIKSGLLWAEPSADTDPN